MRAGATQVIAYLDESWVLDDFQAAALQRIYDQVQRNTHRAWPGTWAASTFNMPAPLPIDGHAYRRRARRRRR